MRLSLMNIAAAGYASKQRQSGTVRLAERDGIIGTHGRVPQAAEERGQAGTDSRDSRQEMQDPARAGDNTAVDFPAPARRLVRSKRWLRCVQLKDGDIGSLW